MKKLKSKKETLRDYILHNTFKYINESVDKIPTDDEGNPLLEYIKYVSLSSVHSLLTSLQRDVSTVIISADEDGEGTYAHTESSVYVVTEEIMQNILDLVDGLNDTPCNTVKDINIKA